MRFGIALTNDALATYKGAVLVYFGHRWTKWDNPDAAVPPSAGLLGGRGSVLPNIRPVGRVYPSLVGSFCPAVGKV